MCMFFVLKKALINEHITGIIYPLVYVRESMRCIVIERGSVDRIDNTYSTIYYYIWIWHSMRRVMNYIPINTINTIAWIHESVECDAEKAAKSFSSDFLDNSIAYRIIQLY